MNVHESLLPKQKIIENKCIIHAYACTYISINSYVLVNDDTLILLPLIVTKSTNRNLIRVIMFKKAYICIETNWIKSFNKTFSFFNFYARPYAKFRQKMHVNISIVIIMSACQTINM